MKNILFVFLSVFSICAVYAQEEPLRMCALEDFRRFEPGEYRYGQAPYEFTRRIEERDGKHILCVGNTAEVLVGWRFNDVRQKNFIMRIRFRFLEENKFLNFTFHGGGGSLYHYFHYRFRLFPQKAFLLLDIRGSERKLNGTKQNPVPHVRNRDINPRLKVNEWIELEMWVRDESFAAYAVRPDGTKRELLKSPILPGSCNQPGIYFGGKAEVEWVKSYLLPEEDKK